MEEMDTLVKENLPWKKKKNKTTNKNEKTKPQAQNIQEIWDNMKRPSLHIIGREGEETRVKRTENIFNKIVEEIFLNLKEEVPIQGKSIQNIKQTGWEKKFSMTHNNQNTKHTEQRRDIKSCKWPSNI